MKAKQLLHKKLSTACPDMHKIRLKAGQDHPYSLQGYLKISPE